MASKIKKDDTEIGQGLLDISVELSTPDLIAGNEFSIYVLLKNPYTVPVLIRNVTVSIPSEIQLPQWIEAKTQSDVEEKKALDAKSLAQQETEVQRTKLTQKIAESRVRVRSLQNELDDMRKKIQETTDEKLKSQFQKEATVLEIEIEKEDIAQSDDDSLLRRKRDTSKASISFDEKAELDTLEIGDFSMMSLNFNKGAKIGDLRVGTIKIGTTSTREVNLESSLPKDTPLQPGDTAVYTIILKTKSNILFRPSQYKLHFNVAYHSGKESKLRVNTAVTNLSIRASISAIMAGALLGGFAGFIAGYISRQLLSTTPFTDFLSLTTFFAFFLSLILSGIAVVFIARKSETQSLISVEDFWGGILSGFLIGYSGVTAFQNLTGIQL